MHKDELKRRLRGLIREELARTDLKALVQEVIEGMDFQAIVQGVLHEQCHMTNSTGPVQPPRVLH